MKATKTRLFQLCVLVCLFGTISVQGLTQNAVFTSTPTVSEATANFSFTPEGRNWNRFDPTKESLMTCELMPKPDSVYHPLIQSLMVRQPLDSVWQIVQHRYEGIAQVGHASATTAENHFDNGRFTWQTSATVTALRHWRNSVWVTNLLGKHLQHASEDAKTTLSFKQLVHAYTFMSNRNSILSHRLQSCITSYRIARSEEQSKQRPLASYR